MAIDVERKLLMLRKTSAQARALFDALLSYEVNLEDTTVIALAKKAGLNQKEVREVLYVLEKLKLGRFWVGRRGAKSRFGWGEVKYKAVIPGPQPGEDEDDDPVGGAEVVVLKGASATPLNKWDVPLARRRQAIVLLPKLVNRADVLKIRDFCDQYLAGLR